jgi:glutamyl-tRNA synthetase
LPPARIAAELQWHLTEQQLDISNGPAIEAVIAVQAERVKTLKELVEVSRYFYEDFAAFDENAAKKHLRPVAAEALALAKEKLAVLTNWQLEPIHEAINAAAEQLGLGMGKVGMPMRVAVTGGGNSPALDQTLLLLGRERTLARIELALDFISKRAEAN